MKRLLAIIAGVITGFLIVFTGDAVIKAINPPPLGLNYMDKNVMVNYIATIPQYILVLMTFFWLLSSFLGGLVTALINGPLWRRPVLSTGGILLAAALLNLIMTAPSHPMWMWIVALVGYIPAALLGAWLVGRKKTTAPENI